MGWDGCGGSPGADLEDLGWYGRSEMGLLVCVEGLVWVLMALVGMEGIG